MNKGRNRGELNVRQLPNMQQQIKLASIGRRNVLTVIWQCGEGSEAREWQRRREVRSSALLSSEFEPLKCWTEFRNLRGDWFRWEVILQKFGPVS